MSLDRTITWGLAGGAALLGFALLLGRKAVKLPLLTMGDSIGEGVGRAIEARLLAGQAFTECRSGEGVEASRLLASNRLTLHPEVRTVVLSTGVNSLGLGAPEVMRQTVQIVDQLRQLNVAVVLIGPPPAFDADGATAQWRAELTALERLHSRMTGRVSLWQLLGDSRNEGYFDSRYGARLHPNADGYARVAAAVLGR
jgi:lysophospholipase L1-like esterase